MKSFKKPSTSRVKKSSTSSSRRKSIGQPKVRSRVIKPLQQNDEPFQRIFDEGPLGMALVDADFRFIKVNNVFCKMLGFPRQELLARTFKDITAPEYIDHDVQSISKLIHGTIPVYRTEKQYRKKNLQTIWGALTVSVIRDKQHQFQYLLAMIEDITDRKRMEETILSRETEFRSLADAMPQIVWIARADGWFKYFNRQWTEYTGLTLNESLGHEWIKPFHPDDRQRAWDAWRNAVTNGGTFSIESRLRQSDGMYRWWLIRGVPVSDTDGQRPQWFGTCTDIHVMKQAQEELNIKEFAIESSLSAISLADLNGYVIFGNRAFMNLWGYTDLKNVIGKHISEFSLSKDKVELAYQFLQADKPYQGEGSFVKQDGTLLYYQLSANLVKSREGKPICLMASFVDITERKHIETELLKTETFLRIALENLPMILYVIDAGGAFKLSVGAGLNGLGLKQNQVAGQSVFDVYKDYPGIKNAVRKALTGELTTFESHVGGSSFINYLVPFSTTQGAIDGVIGVALDITVRVQAESALHESEERFRTLVEGAPASVVMLSSTGEVRYANSMALKMFGYAESTNYRNIPILDHLSQESRDLITERYRLHTQGNSVPEQIEIMGIRTDGTTLPMHVAISHLRLGNEDVSLNFITDITELKRAEEAVRVSEMKYREMVEQINDVLFKTDLEGRITYMSPTVETLGGYTQEETIGRVLFEYIDPVFIPKIRDQMKRVMSGELAPSEFRVKIKSGEYKWVRSSSKRIMEHGRPVGMLGVLTDISTRKKAEETVTLLSHTIKSVRECVSVTDMENNILFVNQSFLDTYGYTEEEVLGKNIGDLVYTKESNREEILKATLLSDWQGERVNRRKDWTEFPVHLSTSTVYDEQTHPIALVGVATDITEQKKLHQELLQSQKMQSIGTLAGGVAHDFNNILGIILAYSSLLKQLRSDDSKHAESIAAINQAVHRGAALVRQILTFARKTEVAFEVININDLVHELTSMLQQTFPKIITLKENTAKNIPLIEVDRSQIHQALLNLCVNARDAMPNGGLLTLETEIVRREQIQEQFPAADRQRYACISVIDSGEGMDEITRLRMFDPFFTTKEKGKGTGLGLSVTYGVIQAHNGFIQSESQLGFGSTFRLYIPIPDIADNIPDEQMVLDSSSPGGTETILVVEDEDLLLNMVHFVLETKGYKVFTAHDGIEAINIYHEHLKEIDLVISDIGLPGITGAEVFKKLKEINPVVKVTLASGYLDPDVKSELFKAGAKEFIQKPYSPDDILRKIRDVLDKTTGMQDER